MKRTQWLSQLVYLTSWTDLHSTQIEPCNSKLMSYWIWGQPTFSQWILKTFAVEIYHQQHLWWGTSSLSARCWDVHTVQVSLSGSRSEPHFSKLPSNHSCVSKDVTCCSSNKKQFSATTLNNKHRKVLAMTKARAKNFSEPPYFYRPFGDSSIISSSILNANGCWLPLRSIGLWLGRLEQEKGESETCCMTHAGKSNEPHIVLYFFSFL